MTTWQEDALGLMYPAIGEGVPTGSGDWRLVVERLEASVSGDPDLTVQWGSGTWGPTNSDDKWGATAWVDVTDYVRGMEWVRGSDEPRGLPQVGAISVELANPIDDDRMDPWVRYTHCRPGTLMRAGLVSETDTRADGWLPLWTGTVESWTTSYVAPKATGYRADSFATVSLTETLGELAEEQGTAVTAVGAGETVVDRVARLLAAANWRYGLTSLFDVDTGEPTVTLQATALSENRVTELQRTGDSTGAVVYCDPTGAVMVSTRATSTTADSKGLERQTRLFDFSTLNIAGDPAAVFMASMSDQLSGTTYVLAFDGDSIETANDRDVVYNDYRWTRVGGSVQPAAHAVSRGRFGTRTSERTDLLCQNDSDVLALATEACNDTARTALRIDNVTFTATGKPDNLLIVAAADLHDLVKVRPPLPSISAECIARIRGMAHQVVPLVPGESVQWTASYALDLIDLTGVTGGMLELI